MQSQPSMREDAYFVLTSFAHVVLTVLFGELLNLTSFPGLLVLAFAVSSKAFALAAGENERFFARSTWTAVPLAAVSLAVLAFLPPPDVVIGVGVLFLYLTYPRVIRAREKSPLDVIFHGSRYALLFLLGYGPATPLNLAGYLGLATVFTFGVTGELLVGLMSVTRTRNSASRLGAAATSRVVNLLIFACIVLGSFIFGLMIEIPIPLGSFSLPLPLVVGVVVAAFVSRPVSSGQWKRASISVRRREILVVVLLVLIIVSVPPLTRGEYSLPTHDTNYTVTVGMRVFVAGQYPWDVQSIVFNYRDRGNFYYVLLHTDGVLELARFTNGTRMPHLAEAKTNFSPFAENQYRIQVSNGTAAVSIDGQAVLTAPVQNPGGEAMISSSVPNQTLWIVSVSQFQVD